MVDQKREDAAGSYVLIHQKVKELRAMIVAQTPKGREQDLALARLDECHFWANDAVVRSAI